MKPVMLFYLLVAAAFPIAAIFFVSPLGPLAKQFMRLLRICLICDERASRGAIYRALRMRSAERGEASGFR